MPHFREYGSLFENLSSLPHVHFTVIERPRAVDLLTYQGYRLTTRVLRLISRCFTLEPFGIYLDPKRWTHESWEMSLLNKRKSVIFLGSWFTPKEVAPLLEYKDALIKLFQPKRIYREKVEALFGTLRSRYSVIVGVHIRRRDYAAFHGGAYLF